METETGRGCCRSLTLLESTGSAAQNRITLDATASVLIPFGLWFPVALFPSTLKPLRNS
jgi:hypothetical protein